MQLSVREAETLGGARPVPAALAQDLLDGLPLNRAEASRWGHGHSGGVFGVAIMTLLVLAMQCPIGCLSVWGERCVGLVLSAIGIWGARATLAPRTAGGEQGGRRQATSPRHVRPLIDQLVTSVDSLPIGE
jgi:hypothetical protein